MTPIKFLARFKPVYGPIADRAPDIGDKGRSSILKTIKRVTSKIEAVAELLRSLSRLLGDK